MDTLWQEIEGCLDKYGPLTYDEIADYLDSSLLIVRSGIDPYKYQLPFTKVGKGSHDKLFWYLPQHNKWAAARKKGLEKELSTSRVLAALESGPKFAAQISGLVALSRPLASTTCRVLATKSRKIGCLSLKTTGQGPRNLYYLPAHREAAMRIKNTIKTGDLKKILDRLFSRLDSGPKRSSQLARSIRMGEALVFYLLHNSVKRRKVGLTYIPTREGTYGAYYLPDHVDKVDARLQEHGFRLLPDEGDKEMQEHKLNVFWIRNSDWILDLLNEKSDNHYIHTTDALIPILLHLLKATGYKRDFLKREVICRTLIGHFIHASEDPTPQLEEWGVPKRLIDRIISDIRKYR